MSAEPAEDVFLAVFLFFIRVKNIWDSKRFSSGIDFVSTISLCYFGYEHVCYLLNAPSRGVESAEHAGGMK
jgi:hypothetical protein